MNERTPRLAQCSSCGASVIWAQWEGSGKRAPLDANPRMDGTIEISHYGWGGVPVIRSIADDDLSRPRYVSHFATCPNASSHRKTVK